MPMKRDGVSWRKLPKEARSISTAESKKATCIQKIWRRSWDLSLLNTGWKATTKIWKAGGIPARNKEEKEILWES